MAIEFDEPSLHLIDPVGMMTHGFILRVVASLSPGNLDEYAQVWQRIETQLGQVSTQLRGGIEQLDSASWSGAAAREMSTAVGSYRSAVDDLADRSLLLSQSFRSTAEDIAAVVQQMPLLPPGAPPEDRPSADPQVRAVQARAQELMSDYYLRAVREADSFAPVMAIPPSPLAGDILAATPAPAGDLAATSAPPGATVPNEGTSAAETAASGAQRGPHGDHPGELGGPRPLGAVSEPPPSEVTAAGASVPGSSAPTSTPLGGGAGQSPADGAGTRGGAPGSSGAVALPGMSGTNSGSPGGPGSGRPGQFGPGGAVPGGASSGGAPGAAPPPSSGKPGSLLAPVGGVASGSGAPGNGQGQSQTRSSTGMAGMAPMGGAARGGDEEEHPVPSYLTRIENGNAIFGVLPLVAPPVIGQ